MDSPLTLSTAVQRLLMRPDLGETKPLRVQHTLGQAPNSLSGPWDGSWQERVDHPLQRVTSEGGAPEEDEVALIVQRGDLAAAEAGVLVEQRGKHAPQAVPQPCVKVVQHQLRLRPGSPSMALNRQHVGTQ